MSINAFKDLKKVDLTSTNGSTPDAFLSAQDIADAILLIISAKPHVEVKKYYLNLIYILLKY